MSESKEEIRKQMEDWIADGETMQAASVIIKDLEDKDWAKKLYLKEEGYLTSKFTLLDTSEDEIELSRLERFIKLALAIRHELGEFEWGEKLENQTLEKSKNLKYRAKFVEFEIDTRRYYENQKDKIIELMNWFESDEGFQSYNLYMTQCQSEPWSKFAHYQNLLNYCESYGDAPLEQTQENCVNKSLHKTYVKNLINSAENIFDYTTLMSMYYNGNSVSQNKSEALKYIDKAIEIWHPEPRTAIFAIRDGYMALEMEKEAINFVKKQMVKVEDKELLEELKDWLKNPY